MKRAFRRNSGSTLLSTLCTSLAICVGFAGLHYYELHRLERAQRLLRDVERAQQELAVGIALTSSAPHAREPGLASLSQPLRALSLAFASAERELQSSLRQDGALAALRASAERCSALLEAPGAAAGGGELLRALPDLLRSAGTADAALHEALTSLRSELNRTLLALRGGAVLLLLVLFWLMYRVDRRRSATLQVLDAIAESSSDPIYAKDTAGRYLFFNKAASRLSGKRSLILGGTDRETLLDGEASVISANDAEIMAARTIRSYEELVSTLDGPRTYLSTKGPLMAASGELTGVFGISRDITERKRAERMLEESRAKLESVIESLYDGLLIVDCESGEVHWNRAALAIHGFTSSAQLPEDPRSLDLELSTPEGDLIAFDDWPLNRVRRGETIDGMVLRVRRPSVQLERFMNVNGALVRGEGGAPRFALVSIHDVTLSRRAEEAVQHTQRLEALGTLSAGVAHDFNNILFAITGNAQLALDDVPADSRLAEQLNEVLRAAARATDLVRRILLYARYEEPKRRPLELWPVVEEALKMLRPTLPAQIELEARGAPLGRSVRADASQLHQVITNLVTNAAYAVTQQPTQPARIRIALETRRLAQPLTSGGRTLSAGVYAQLTVEDNGCGMTEATLRRVFDPFFTTKPVGAGTGLGLSVVHGIVSSHEGLVTIESQPAAGTTVRVLLPLGSELVRTCAAPEAPAAVSGAHVLFLDDESALVRLATQGLPLLGHTVSGFVSANEALRAFSADPGRFDVLVTDLSMHELSGFELTRRVLAIRPELPVVMMTGFVGPDDRALAHAAGVRELLQKPVTMKALSLAIERSRGSTLQL